MAEDIRSKIVATARRWIGTAFVHQGRISKTTSDPGGCDCLGLFMGVSKELNLKTKSGMPLTAFDRADYGIQSNVNLAEEIGSLFARTEGETKEADLMIMRLDQWHMGFASYLGNTQYIIHACSRLGQVTEHPIDSYWNRKIYVMFDILSGVYI